MDFTPDPEDGLVRRKEFVHNGGDAAELRRDHRQGRLVRVTRGVYRTVDPDEDTAEPVYDEAYRQLVIAIAGRSTERVVSHSSAAVIHGLNQLAPDQRRVHFYVRAGGRRGREVHLHTGSLTRSDVTVVDGVLLTKLGITACDVARQGSFAQAVVVLDHALRLGVDKAELTSIVGRSAKSSGIAVLRRALDVADRNSESVGESLSRSLFIEWADIPLPTLQTEFHDEKGILIARVDFDWEGRVVGEFDGKVKYEKHRRPGESVSDAVIREKRREDRLREQGIMVIRWVWDDLRNPQLLRSRIRKVLHGAGVI
ncbi:type IV toxin-antitoxin system AbiEi family antitoxin domain-containing protein [Gordonia rubripertincta]|uniref:Type IV toxin-antitoxin system AbiEi family antitoxin domain-containing protein n=1 Tax=Gordonia rubripertincta TaxID=36822 RepID=A0ABT4MSZ7_GORRU|nr:hypothetical protein [Gordonia rubripertincta]MCZ4550115.1 hypothetical protein [Gordonia rubripertincta]